MSEIKALESLRNCLSSATYDGLLDAIQDEVDERFMELPCDKDGVPIHVGDVVQFRNDAPVTVDSIGTSKVYANDSGFFGSNGGFYGQGTLKNVLHVKPRTVEDVLRDYWREACELPVDMSDESTAEAIDKLVVKYRAEICEMRLKVVGE